MPVLGLGLHVLIAIYFGIHAVRTGQQIYWLFILFAFPLLGSIVYFVAIYLPSSRLERRARQVVTAAAIALDPTRELRDAQAAFEYAATAQNQMRLADALLATGSAEDAAERFEACLKGPFATDPQIRFGAVSAFVECARYEQALSHLDAVRESEAAFRSHELAILRARALAGSGREAKAEFESAVARFGSFEAKAEYAIWAAASGDDATAARLKHEIDDSMKRWTQHTRGLNAPLVKRLNTACEAVHQRALTAPRPSDGWLRATEAVNRTTTG